LGVNGTWLDDEAGSETELSRMGAEYFASLNSSELQENSLWKSGDECRKYAGLEQA
jgi:hypothetical protein